MFELSPRSLALLIEQDVIGSLDRGLVAPEDAQILDLVARNRQSSTMVAYINAVRGAAADAIRAFPSVDPHDVVSVVKLQSDIRAFIELMKWARDRLLEVAKSQDDDDAVADPDAGDTDDLDPDEHDA